MPAADLGMPSRLRPTARAVGQVMTALKNSKNEEGPTMNEIVKFISSALLNPVTKRQVLTALKRGVEFGIISRKKGRYVISSPEDNVEVPVEKVHGLKTKLQKVKKRRGAAAGARARRTGGKPPQARRDDSDCPETSYELRDVYRNLSYRPSAVSSATTLYQDCRDPEFE